MVHHSACLLPLLLICLAGFSASETEHGGIKADAPYGPSSMEINGVNIVTVGIPYGFTCWADCYPNCQYTWTRGNVTSEGSELNLFLQHLEPTQTLTCTAVNPATGKTDSAQKTLQVTAGPKNIQISGPPMLTFGTASNFTCSADCFPSCTYSWTIILEDEIFSTGQGNTISVSPPASTITSETLLCEAQNTASKLYISTLLSLWVASLSDVSISGDSTVTMGQQYIFTCSALCVPPCVFTWKYMGKTFKGQQIQLPILSQGNKTKCENMLEMTFNDYSKTEPLICEARNTASNVTMTATMNLTVIDPISVRPASQAPPVEGEPFSLQCVGSQNPASITWLKNNQPMLASERVQFSPDNTTVNFIHLLQTDDGLYQCVVAEGGTPIHSVGYKMQVNYGPDKVVIVEPNKGPVGEVIFALPGSTMELQCLVACFPVCSIAWFYNSTLLSRNTSILFRPITSPYKDTLTCEAFNAVTKKNKTAETTVEVPEGPKNVVISGPDSLEIGVTAKFTCSAECTPPCIITWNLYRRNVTGDMVDITVNRQVVSESISCHAENAVTGKTVTVNKTLSVSNPISVRPASQAPPVEGEPFSLQCVGSQNPASITWLKNNQPMLASERVQFSPDNTTVNFIHLLQTDDGLYQCVVSEGGSPIQSTGYKMQVNYGPDKVVIVEPNKGPVGEVIFALPGSTMELQCLVACFPVCSIAWFYNSTLLSRNTSIRFTPITSPYKATLTCEAFNAVTKKNKTAETTVVVPEGPKNVVISGPDSLKIGVTANFTCSAECTPPCIITWNLYRRNVTGDMVDITVNRQVVSESISCHAENVVTGKTVTVNKTLSVSNPISVRPASQAPPVEGEPFSLQCVGSQNPASITWLKNNQPMLGSERVQFSPDNTTVNFIHLLQTDDGLYQCVVSEGGSPIQSTGYKMQVNYGPDKVVIVEPNKGPVGEVIFALPGSTMELQCLVACFPVCSIAWFYNSTLLSRNTSILFTPITSPYKDTLTCEAFNAVTKKNKTAETTVEVPEGPKKVVISGPDSLEIGVTAKFTCSAECTPPCIITWNLYGKNVTGGMVDITVNRQVAIQSIRCYAENTVTGKMVTVNKTLSVSDLNWCGC